MIYSKQFIENFKELFPKEYEQEYKSFLESGSEATVETFLKENTQDTMPTQRVIELTSIGKIDQLKKEAFEIAKKRKLYTQWIKAHKKNEKYYSNFT